MRRAMMKRTLLTTIAAVFSSMFIAAILFAGTTVPDSFEMNTSAYEEHTYNLVPFSHKKHITEYNTTCGDCHHDDKGKPLANLKEGDNVQKCIECHSKPGRVPKEEKGLSDAEKRQYHAEAMHDNCKTCHKEHNNKVKKETGKKGEAPTSCNSCHPGGKKK